MTANQKQQTHISKLKHIKLESTEVCMLSSNQIISKSSKDKKHALVKKPMISTNT
jgi:hypothetical protein